MNETSIRFASRLTESAVRATEKQIEIKVPWGKLAAISWGNPSNPPVLLYPGRFDTCATYRPLVSLLPDNFFYVGVDLPGNGWSDPFLRGAKFTVMDFLPTVARVKEHFKWNDFVFIGHSLGAVISKYYNLIYPGHIKRIVELDPMPAYIPHDDFRTWYIESYEEFYSNGQYQKLNSGYENAPKYTYEEVKTRLMKARGLDEKSIENVLERCLVSAGDGLYRLTWDQRYKTNFFLPFPSDTYKDRYTASSTPILAILSSEFEHEGEWVYKRFPFATDESAWRNGNYKCVLLKGGHDVHLHNLEECAKLITEFLK